MKPRNKRPIRTDDAPASDRRTGKPSYKRASSAGEAPSSSDTPRRKYSSSSSDRPSGNRFGKPDGERSSYRGEKNTSDSDRPRRSYGSSSSSDRPSGNRFKKSEGERSFQRADKEGSEARKPTRFGVRRSYDKPTEPRGDSDRKPYQRRFDDKGDTRDTNKERSRSTRPSYKSESEGSERRERFGEKKSYARRDENTERTPRYGSRKPYGSTDSERSESEGRRKPYARRDGDSERSRGERSGFGQKSTYGRSSGGVQRARKSYMVDENAEEQPEKSTYQKREYRPHRQPLNPVKETAKDETIRLNRFIAQAGFGSRRDADEIIKAGRVLMNGKIVTDLAIQVGRRDKVSVDGTPLSAEPMRYILMNKPKDTITTTDDEKGRRTVMDLIEQEVGARVYPVGRLDRNTTGILVLTNDGELANRLMHPSYKVGKTYEVQADNPISDEHIEALLKGVVLDDGEAKAYKIVRVLGTFDRIELSVREGRNRLVRRMIESLGLEVTELKRILYAGLTLKGLRSGRWRFLRPIEINNLRKHVKLKELTFTTE